MGLLLLFLRVLLAAIFFVAGFAKLADQKGSRKAMRDFGVPNALSPVVSIALPALEIAIAAGLMFIATSWVAAISAVVLLTIFTANMTYQIVKGKSPDCHCFGQLHSEPVGWTSVIRNFIIVLPALFLVAAGMQGQGTGLTALNAADAQLLALSLVGVCLAVCLYYLIRVSNQQKEMIKRIELVELIARDGSSVERDDAGHPTDGLPIGAPVPRFELADLDGQKFFSDQLARPDRPALLFFVSPTCTPCEALIPAFKEWEEEMGKELAIYFVSSGTADENREKFGDELSGKFLLQKDREFADAVSARWTPSALFIDSKSKIASHIAAGDTAIKELVENIERSDILADFVHFRLSSSTNETAKVAIGSKVPSFSAKTISNVNMDLSSFGEKDTLLTFWSPTCPHCTEMADQIRSWEKVRSLDDPELIMISIGDDVEAHRELGLTSEIILDPKNKLTTKMGMHGTPSAILVDKNGVFASELAIGAPSIWALIGRYDLNNGSKR